MKRNSEKYLKEWYFNKSRKPLIIRGARQVGKSTLVRNFARLHQIPLFEINLEKHKRLNTLFASFDIKRVKKELEYIVDKGPFNKGLLFLDEIQATPEALPCLRYFYEELPELPVVAAGSLLEFVLSDHTFSMPVGRIEYHFLGPLRFEEYLEAMHEDSLVEYIKNFKFSEQSSPVMHDRLTAALRDFFFVGGMPEAVAQYSENHDFAVARKTQRSILDTFRDDFGKYATRVQTAHLQDVFDYLPSGIGDKFVYSHVNRSLKAGEVRYAYDLLASAGVTQPVFATSGAGLPLSAHINRTIFKPLFLDIGLMNAALGSNFLPLEALQNSRLINKGALAEQFVGQELLFFNEAYEKPLLHYWLREGRNANAEVDYLIQSQASIVPVAVKAGAAGHLKSLHQFVANYGSSHAVRFDLNEPSIQKSRYSALSGTTSVEINFTLISLPLYFAGQLKRMIAPGF